MITHPPAIIQEQSLEQIASAIAANASQNLIATQPQPCGTIEAIELRVTYEFVTISTRAKSFDAMYQVTRTERFEAVVDRKALRNPTKLNAKLLAQARNHFTMRHQIQMTVAPHFFALPESIRVTRVALLGQKNYTLLNDVAPIDGAPDDGLLQD